MGQPDFNPQSIPFDVNTQANSYTIEHAMGSSEIGAVSLGNPHAVIVVDNVDTAPVAELGAILEPHKQFPKRANIGFMQILSRSAIKLRVFERGVGETQACGTGACAAVASGIQRGLLDNEVDVSLLGGNLTIQWQGDGSSLVMLGDATKVFDGKIKL
jgi:diaminopimelate epimerase